MFHKIALFTILLLKITSLLAVGSDLIPKATVTSYETLPCATEAEYAEFKSKLNIDESNLTGALCHDGSKKEKFAKVIKFLVGIKLSVPRDWKGGGNEALSEPFAYLISKCKKIKFTDESSGGVVAYNSLGIITIGDYFFTQAPLDAIGTLIHEAHHSESSDPGHTRCTGGDRAQEWVACDAWFDTGAKAGAYSYGVSFLFGLAKFGPDDLLSPQDRDHLRLSALSLIGRRFNVVPDNLGLPFDKIYAIDDLGNLYYHHPILRKLTPIAMDDGVAISDISFDRRSNGVLLYRDDGTVLNNKTSYEPFTDFFSELLTSPQNALQAVIMTGYNSSDDYLLTKESEILKLSLDPSSLKERYLPTPFKSDRSLKKLVHGRGSVRFALANDGTLFHFADDFKDGAEGTLVVDRFKDPDGIGWSDLYGGLLHTEVMGISFNGKFYREVDSAPVDITPSIAQYQTLYSYQEGVSLRVAKPTEKSDLYIQRYDDDKKRWFELRIYPQNGNRYIINHAKSFVIARVFKPGPRFMGDHPVSEEFIKECELTKWDVDPWSGRGIGVSRYNELVFEGGRLDRCQVFDDHGVLNVSDFRFVGTSITEPGTFSSASLEILTEFGWKKITPYADGRISRF